MKRAGVYLIIAFSLFLIVQIIWFYNMIPDFYNSLKDAEEMARKVIIKTYLKEILLHTIYVFSGFFGILSGVKLYKSSN